MGKRLFYACSECEQASDDPEWYCKDHPSATILTLLEGPRWKPGMVVRFWCYDSTAFRDAEVARIRAELPPALGIKKDYGDRRQQFFRVYKKTGAERAKALKTGKE